MENKKNILFISQDQGSANALIPVIFMLNSEEAFRIELVAAKQSINAFQTKGFKPMTLKGRGFEKVLVNKPDLVVTGASMLESVEKTAIRWSRGKGIKTLTVLDYWGNYWHRFTVTGEREPKALPDIILVPDDLARDQMIKVGFPPGKLTVTGTPYFDSFPQVKGGKRKKQSVSVLFISQPIYKCNSYFSDKKKIEDVIKVCTESDQKLELIIKPHPKEKPGFFQDLNDSIKIAWEEDIKTLLKKSDLIIGTDSTVLFEAVFSGKPVISYQPEPGRKDNLITNKLGLSYLVKSRNELRTIIQKIIKGELKTKIIPTIKYYNDGNCCSRVIKKIKQILQEI